MKCGNKTTMGETDSLLLLLGLSGLVSANYTSDGLNRLRSVAVCLCL